MRILANPRSNSSLRWTGPVDGYYRVQTVSQDPGIDILLEFAVPAGEGYQGGYEVYIPGNNRGTTVKPKPLGMNQKGMHLATTPGMQISLATIQALIIYV